MSQFILQREIQRHTLSRNQDKIAKKKLFGARQKNTHILIALNTVIIDSRRNLFSKNLFWMSDFSFRVTLSQ